MLLETGGGMLHALPWLGDAPFIASINGDIWSTHPLDTLPQEPAGLAHVVLIPLPTFRKPGAFEATASPLLGATAKPHTLAGIGVYRPALVRDQAPGKFSITPLLTAAAESWPPDRRGASRRMGGRGHAGTPGGPRCPHFCRNATRHGCNEPLKKRPRMNRVTSRAGHRP